MEKLLRVAEMRDLEQQVTKEEISYSRMVELINEKHFLKLVELRQEIEITKVIKLEELKKELSQFIKIEASFSDSSRMANDVIDFLIKKLK